ncbi:DUF3828 domain-containing protein [Cronobacter sakazakii]|uniref:DUF3828 domain-containing protein n=1 Tax=Cronobacter sakazakii TaxID=28141 RepID=UPI000DA24AF7|nr:DUF3828 domain-containing protein [Cronobacter sakazakii]
MNNIIKQPCQEVIKQEGSKRHNVNLCMLILFLTLFSINKFCTAADCQSNPVQITKDFYTKYMDFVYKMTPPDSVEYKRLIRRYLTPDFIKQIREARICEKGGDPVCSIGGVEPQLGYVYILRAQDVYDDWHEINVKSITIKKNHSAVKVSLGGVGEKEHVIMVALKKYDGCWKINKVSDLSPAPYRFQ